MQRYDIDESRGYPSPVIVPDDLGDYYLVEEVDAEIAVLIQKIVQKDEQSQYDHTCFNKEYRATMDKKNQIIATLVLDRDTAMSQLKDAEGRVKRQTDAVAQLETNIEGLKGKYEDHDAEIAALKMYKDATINQESEREKQIKDLEADIEVLTTCRDHWKTSFEVLKARNAKHREALEKCSPDCDIDEICKACEFYIPEDCDTIKIAREAIKPTDPISQGIGKVLIFTQQWAVREVISHESYTIQM